MAGLPPPRYGARVADGWVPYLRLDSAQNVYALLNTLWAQEPVLLQGAPLAAGLVGKWSFAQLVSCRVNAGRRCMQDRAPLPSTNLRPLASPACRRRRWGPSRSCACCAPTQSATASSSGTTQKTSTAGEGRPLVATRLAAACKLPEIAAGATLAPGAAPEAALQTAGLLCLHLPPRRLYHVREPETQRLDMSLPDFVQCCQTWRTRRLYLRVRGGACPCSSAGPAPL